MFVKRQVWTNPLAYCSGKGNIEVLEKLWDWAKELQLKPEELRDGVCLLNYRCGQSAWHMAARRSYEELLEKMWDFVKKNSR